MNDSYSWERIDAEQIKTGDLIAKTRNEEPAEVTDVGPRFERAIWIHFGPGNRSRPRRTTKFWRAKPMASREEALGLAPEEQASRRALAPAIPGHPGFSAEVQDALQSAGLSRNSELTPEQLERAEQLASGAVQFTNESSRGHWIMRGERSSNMAASSTSTKKGASKPPSKPRNPETAKALEVAVAILKASRKPLSRREIHDKAVAKGVDLGLKPSGSPKIGGVVNEAKAREQVISGYVITNPERGKYAVKKAAASAKANGGKASAKASSTKKASGGKAAAKKGAASAKK